MSDIGPVRKSWGFEDPVQVKYKIFRCSLYLSILNTEHNKTVIYHLPYIGNTDYWDIYSRWHFFGYWHEFSILIG